MTATIADHPFWRLVFDADGDTDRQLADTLDQGITATGVTDLVIFSHGWNSGNDTSIRLYQRWFELLAPHLDPTSTVGFVGVMWPSQLWRDEPIPDMAAEPVPAADGSATLVTRPRHTSGPPTIDPRVLADLDIMFPNGTARLDTIARLLAAPASPRTATTLLAELRAWHHAVADGFDDGELPHPGTPGMLDPDRDPADVFAGFASGLTATGVEFDTLGGAADLGEIWSRVRDGAKEALRQLSYWQMKNRAGSIGRHGLGPLVTALAADRPGLRIHLVGHSFGARVVAYTLDGLGAPAVSPVKSITLLQGAFSRFAFTERLPFRQGGGALAGRLARLDGPLTVCHSSHDSALSVMYPLAALAVGDDTADAGDRLFRYRAMGSHGAFEPHARQPLGAVGATYPFQPGRILNLDASLIVTNGAPPSGAHSDIFKTELAWTVAAAAGLT